MDHGPHNGTESMSVIKYSSIRQGLFEIHSALESGFWDKVRQDPESPATMGFQGFALRIISTRCWLVGHEFVVSIKASPECVGLLHRYGTMHYFFMRNWQEQLFE